jgi:hypothetical protein
MFTSILTAICMYSPLCIITMQLRLSAAPVIVLQRYVFLHYLNGTMYANRYIPDISGLTIASTFLPLL